MEPRTKANSPTWARLIPVAAATRSEMLQAVLEAAGDDDAIIATTGYTGRELYALADRPGHFYMTGSMGCAASIGLGIATAQPDRRVVVLDGDGALLMRLGALAADVLARAIARAVYEATAFPDTGIPAWKDL